MRFPTPGKLSRPQEGGGPARGDYPVSKPHNGTLLDGEMVVDEDKADGRKYRR